MSALPQVEGQEIYGSRAILSPTDAIPDLHHSTTAKMDFLHNLMLQQGRPSQGMSWRLLLLEWRYDLVVLFGNVRDWMNYVDRSFNR